MVNPKRRSSWAHFEAVAVGAAFLLFFAICVGLAIFGIVVATTNDKYPPVLGLAALGASACAVFRFADRFVRVLPGILGIAAIKSLFAAISGYTVNDHLGVHRATALGVFISSGLLAVAMTMLGLRKLTALDKGVVVALFLSIVTALANDHLLVGCLISLASIGGLWTYSQWHVSKRSKT